MNYAFKMMAVVLAVLATLITNNKDLFSGK
jgi:hypothetical protein